MSAVLNATTGRGASLHTALVAGEGSQAIAFHDGAVICRARFRRQVLALASRLPAHAYALNLCEDRYRFLVAFCAATIRGQATLLPPARAPAIIDDLRRRHPDSHVLDDDALEVLAEDEGELPAIASDAIIAIGFTSGSTGQPQGNVKRWGAFSASTSQNLAALADLLAPDAITPLVATVPPQHMYGMEMSVLLPLLGPVAVHTAKPFFPGDVARALGDAPRPPLLVTTPVHLRALVESDIALPPLAGIITATAPLLVSLAQAAEQRFGTEVRELFGSTETCVIARRRTAVDIAWTPLPGVRLHPQPDGTLVEAPHLATPVVLADLVELRGGGFVLHGRSSDLLEIAGKRASLGDLTRKLLAVPGVEDGVVFQLDDADAAGIRRIAALAVAPGLSARDVATALREAIDPVFLPRPLRCVAKLPRNETGKLPREALLALIKNPSQS